MKSPFLVGCQRCKMPASRYSALLKPSSVSLLPQYEHPGPLNALVLTDSCQLWPHSLCHHTRAESQHETSDGLRSPFRSSSHCAGESAYLNRGHHAFAGLAQEGYRPVKYVAHGRMRSSSWTCSCPEAGLRLSANSSSGFITPSPSLRMSWLNSIGRVVTPLILTMQSELLRQPRDEGMFPLGQGARDCAPAQRRKTGYFGSALRASGDHNERRPFDDCHPR